MPRSLVKYSGLIHLSYHWNLSIQRMISFSSFSKTLLVWDSIGTIGAEALSEGLKVNSCVTLVDLRVLLSLFFSVLMMCVFKGTSLEMKEPNQ